MIPISIATIDSSVESMERKKTLKGKDIIFQHICVLSKRCFT